MRMVDLQLIRLRQGQSLAVAVFLLFCFLHHAKVSAQDAGYVDSATASQVLPYGQMSQNAYSDQWVPADTPGWTRVDSWQKIFTDQGRSDQINAAALTGFSAQVFMDAKGNIAIAYRGTVLTNIGSDYADWQAWYQAQVPNQFRYARELAILAKKEYPTAQVNVTGHSLGGAIATYVGQQVPGVSRVITFNAPNFGTLSAATRAGVSQINVIVQGDVISDVKTGAEVGNLPGKTFYVNSTTNRPQSSVSRTEGTWKPQDAHGLTGIIVALCNASSSSCPQQANGNSATFKTESNALAPATPRPAQPANHNLSATQLPVPRFPTSLSNAAHPLTPFAYPGPLAPPPRTTNLTPGGISLSKAAAERLPLDLTLEGAFVQDGRIVLAGHRNNEFSIDAAIFLTALRATCEGSDPYFSLDADNISSWLEATNEADKEFMQDIKDDFRWDFRKGVTRKSPSILKFRTISASRDYPHLWSSLLVKFPDLRSRLVFRPDWLRQTRFGEILYKADVLLKELAGGAPTLDDPRLRASVITDYVSATERIAAKRLLYNYNGWPEKLAAKAGGRIWYDLSETSEAVVEPPESLPPSRSELRDLLESRRLLSAHAGRSIPALYAEDGGAIDLSSIFPRMYVRVFDPATHRDSTGNFPGLNELTAEANKTPQRYAAAYKEYQLLVDVFRAYLVAVRVKKTEPGVCATLPEALLNSEKTSSPLPKYHPTELTFTIGWYEYTDGRVRRAIAGNGGLFQGGVSIGATRYLRQVAARVTETAIIRQIKKEASRPGTGFRWKDGSGLEFISFIYKTASPPLGQSVSNALIINPLTFDRSDAPKTKMQWVMEITAGILLFGTTIYIVLIIDRRGHGKLKTAPTGKTTPNDSHGNAYDKSGRYQNGAWAMPDQSQPTKSYD
jgi:hypothetical protein